MFLKIIHDNIKCNNKYLPGANQNVVTISEKCFKVIRVRIVTRKYFIMFRH